MLHFDEIVFGPIYSRRLGNSLGINILPPIGKLCNFDCIYCECGWNKESKSGGSFPSVELVGEALEKKLFFLKEKGEKVDSITFSGNGEPTLHPDFASIVGVTLTLREKYFPEAKVSVLSNATKLKSQEVVAALKKVDMPILKLDAVDQDRIKYINRPTSKYDVEEVIKDLLSFKGEFVLQTMFLKSPDFDSSSEQILLKWMEVVRRLKPREIMVYTIDRETPQKDLKAFTAEEMKKMVLPLIKEGFNIQISGKAI